MSWSSFAEDVGFESVSFPDRYDFALSFAGSDRDIADAVFSELQDSQAEVFYDKNEQSRLLAEDVEDYLRPIYHSDAAFVVAIMGKEYPKRIWTKLESEAFRERLGKGEVIPVLVDDAELSMFDPARNIGYHALVRGDTLEGQVQELVGLLLKKLTDSRP